MKAYCCYRHKELLGIVLASSQAAANKAAVKRYGEGAVAVWEPVKESTRIHQVRPGNGPGRVSTAIKAARPSPDRGSIPRRSMKEKKP